MTWNFQECMTQGYKDARHVKVQGSQVSDYKGKRDCSHKNILTNSTYYL